MLDRTLRDPPLAVVTGVSSRVAFELARQCAGNGFDLFVAAEDATVQDLGARLRVHGTAVQTAQADPAEPGGVQRLLQLLGCRPVHVLVAHAGHGLDQVLAGTRPARRPAGPDPFVKAYLKGTVELIQAVARLMHAGGGRVLLLGPTRLESAGSLQALCRGTRQFIGGFADHLREEVADSGLTVTCGMPPGAPPMEPPAAAWASVAFRAMMHGDPGVSFSARHSSGMPAATP